MTEIRYCGHANLCRHAGNFKYVQKCPQIPLMSKKCPSERVSRDLSSFICPEDRTNGRNPCGHANSSGHAAKFKYSPNVHEISTNTSNANVHRMSFRKGLEDRI
jgi:hypothetical protein